MITQEILKQKLSYDPDTGLFTWLDAGTNKRLNGKRAGSISKDGYELLCVNKRQYRSHVLAWIYMTGKLPTCQIDHINRVKNDNRFCNLREASKSENQWNIGKRTTNKSGFIGVSFSQHAKKWLASATLNGRSVHLGLYTNPFLASLAYQEFITKNRGHFLKEDLPL